MVVKPVKPSGEPLGLNGYTSVGVDCLFKSVALSIKRKVANLFANTSLTAFLSENSAKPSPCATAIGMRLPAMPLKKSDGDFNTSTMAKRASNCSDLLRTKCGHCSLPGIIACKLLIIWQPLHTPSANESLRLKKAENSSLARRLNKIDFAQPSPAPSTSP